jgi:hypothetical protein
MGLIIVAMGIRFALDGCKAFMAGVCPFGVRKGDLRTRNSW